MAKKFFYVCAGLFLLALSYHLGARSAQAQAGSSVVGFASNLYWAYAMTPNGDCYAQSLQGGNAFGGNPPLYMGNFWGPTGPVSVQPHSFGQLKARFRDPAPTGR